MKKLSALLVLLAIIAGLFFLLKTKNPPSYPSAGQDQTTSGTSVSSISAVQTGTKASRVMTTNANISPQIPSAQTDLASRAASPNPTSDPEAATNEPPALPPVTVLDKTRVLIHNYHAAFGENPVGTNPEITAALQGKNPKQINFLAESGLRLNGKGELVDGYGTPFFFHQISGNEMEIRSAGPDKIMWTADDLVTK